MRSMGILWINCSCCTVILKVVPSDGVFTRRHTAECAFCTVFYSVFCFSTMLPWGGRGGGGAGTTDVTDGTGGDANVPCNLLMLLMLRHAGVGGMLTFHVTCSCCWCFATLGWGDGNVPCNLLMLLMLRHAGVGGMLTFHVTCSCCWCFATLGWGGC